MFTFNLWPTMKVGVFIFIFLEIPPQNNKQPFQKWCALGKMTTPKMYVLGEFLQNYSHSLFLSFPIPHSPIILGGDGGGSYFPVDYIRGHWNIFVHFTKARCKQNGSFVVFKKTWYLHFRFILVSVTILNKWNNCFAAFVRKRLDNFKTRWSAEIGDYKIIL